MTLELGAMLDGDGVVVVVRREDRVVQELGKPKGTEAPTKTGAERKNFFSMLALFLVLRLTAFTLSFLKVPSPLVSFSESTPPETQEEKGVCARVEPETHTTFTFSFVKVPSL